MNVMTLSRTRHPEWCSRLHDRHDSHVSRSESVQPHCCGGRGDAIAVVLVDIGTSGPGGGPDPVVRMYKGEERASLLTPSEARQLAATLLALTARADST